MDLVRHNCSSGGVFIADQDELIWSIDSDNRGSSEVEVNSGEIMGFTQKKKLCPKCPQRQSDIRHENISL